jgi:myosin heavy subunit
MDAKVIIPIGGFILAILGLLHQLIIKKKDATIEGQDKEIARLQRLLTEAKESSPDILAERYKKKLDRQEAEMTELLTERETDNALIKKKETQMTITREEIANLQKQMEEAQRLLEEYEYFKDQFSCEHCGAELIRMADYDEMSDIAFACGNSFSSPCPYDPEFPTLDEYELTMRTNRGTWYCQANPRTKNARKLRLQSTWGDTEEQAKQRMEERYKLASKDVPPKT